MKRILYTQFLLLLVMVSAGQCPADSSLLLQFKFSSNYADSSLYNHPVTVMGTPQLTTDAKGNSSKACFFNGVNAHLVVSDSNTNYKCNFPISVAMWIKPDTLGVYMPLFTNEDNQNTYTGVWLQTTDLNTIGFSFGNGISTGADFRNSITSATAVPIHQWTHVVAVVRGVNDFSLYFNGQPENFALSGNAQTLAYTHSVNEPARIGQSFKGTTSSRYFYGSMDEIGFWNDSLTAEDAKYLYTQAPVYQSIFSANTVTECPNENVELTAAADCNVAWSTGATTPTITVSAGAGELVKVWMYNNHGTVTYDSIWVEAIPFTTDLTTVGNILTATQTGGTYQWFNCNTNTPINNATSQSYTATTSGSYAAVISKDGCTDTSQCISITGVGLNEAFASTINIYPNPFNDYIIVGATEMADGVLLAELFDATGRLVKSVRLQGSETALELARAESGIYTLVVTQAGQRHIHKLVKN
jgi:hypothetical protein